MALKFYDFNTMKVINRNQAIANVDKLEVGEIAFIVESEDERWAVGIHPKNKLYSAMDLIRQEYWPCETKFTAIQLVLNAVEDKTFTAKLIKALVASRAKKMTLH